MPTWLSLSLPNPFSGDGDKLQSPAVSGIDNDNLRETMTGIKNDLVEIRDSFKSGLSDISKLASKFLRFGEDVTIDDRDEDYDDVAVTEEVVEFVTVISERPQLWTDFPFSLPTAFDMSDCQREHMATIEQFVPALGFLRQKVSRQLKDEQFWMIYFILLLSRLDQYHFELLSTPEIAEVWDMLQLQLQLQNTKNVSEEDVKFISLPRRESQLELHDIPAESANASQDRRSVNSETPRQQLENEKTLNTTSSVYKQFENEVNLSISDHEDNDHDDDCDLSDRLQETKPTHNQKVSSSCESHKWFLVNQNCRWQGSQQKARESTHGDKDSEGDESNDWITIDENDLES